MKFLFFPNSKFQIPDSKAGFTLLEMLVVMVIITLLSVLVVANYQWGGYQLAIQRSGHILAQELRRTQEMSMSSREITGPPPYYEKVIPSGGYGLFLQELKNPPFYEIVIFADCDADRLWKPGARCGTPGQKFPEIIKYIELEKGVKIENLSPSGPLSIIFEPPDPIIIINEETDVSATIILSGETDIITVSVNQAGLIEIQ